MRNAMADMHMLTAQVVFMMEDNTQAGDDWCRKWTGAALDLVNIRSMAQEVRIGGGLIAFLTGSKRRYGSGGECYLLLKEGYHVLLSSLSFPNLDETNQATSSLPIHIVDTRGSGY